jgi:ethanolamine utilization protein EutN
MRIAEVIGTVTLNRWHPSLTGARLKLVVPLSLADLKGQTDRPRAEDFAVFDELGAGIGSRIAVSEGREAAMPFYPDVKPIDAYNAAILDTIDIVEDKAESRT